MTDDDLLTAFESCTLPFAEWTHRAHIRVAYTYLRRYDFDQALSNLRTHIQRYNTHHKVEESPTSGYNETTTHAFIHLIAAVMRTYEKTHPVATADEFCDMHPQLMTKHILRLFYSPQQRMHPDAKKQFIPPDLAPLPILTSTPTSPEYPALPP